MMKIETEIQRDTARDLQRSATVLQGVSCEILSCAMRLQDTQTVYDRTIARLLESREGIEPDSEKLRLLGKTLEEIAEKYEMCEKTLNHSSDAPNVWFPIDLFPHSRGYVPIDLPDPVPLVLIRPYPRHRDIWRRIPAPFHHPDFREFLLDGMWPVAPRRRLHPRRLQEIFDIRFHALLR